MQSREKKRPLELYIHIPFCIRKCLYCDFLSFQSEASLRDQYIKKLIEETEAAGVFAKSPELYPGYSVTSIFIGGGTPSILEAEQISQLLLAVRNHFEIEQTAEITIEANPGTVDRKKLEVYKNAGINRLSLGLQSADDGELKILGRIHTFQDFLNSYEAARNAGFENINLDLMSALPGQDEASYKRTLEKAVALNPEHISAYSLIIEDGTEFSRTYGKMKEEIEQYGCVRHSVCQDGRTIPLLPDEETERQMYHFTKSYLKENGYERYEISNYAKAGKECRHNIGYWTGRDYLGLGLGAASYFDGRRFSNERELKNYLLYSGEDFRSGKHQRDCHRLNREEKIEEMMFLGLRLSDGVSGQEFFRRFGVSIESVYQKELDRFVKQGLMESSRRASGNETFWKLTEYGMDVSNYVMSEFLLS